jgi:copper(I)-binding protein
VIRRSLPEGHSAHRGVLARARRPVSPRWGALAGSAALLVLPALAGCEAGLNAPTLQFHQASGGAHAVVDGITISNAFVLAAPTGASLPAGAQAGLFLGLFNNGSSADTLTGVSLPNGGAATASIAGGSVTVPADGSANLTGPTPQLVLTGLTQPLSGGQAIAVTLNFQEAGPVTLEVPVEPQSYYYSTLSQPPSAAPSATPVPATSAPTATSPAATAPAATQPPAASTATPTPTK